MVDMVPISSVVSDYDKLRMTSEGHSIGEQPEKREEAALQKASEPEDMEDGEICEDDDEDVKPAPTPASTASSSRSSHSSSAKDARHSARASHTSHGPQTALSSWSGTVNARAHAAAGSRSPQAVAGDSCFDPNEEYYRSGGNEDRDYRFLDDNRPVIQDFSADGEHRSPPSPSRYDSKRRRRSVSPDDYRHGSKRARATSPPYHRSSSRRAPLGRGRWAERQICKFFREGYCRDGENCNYSHDAADSMRKPEICKFYQHGYCKKGLQCPLLHGEFPCKAFHKGECSKEQCQYSHVALNEFTQAIFDQMMKDEELAAKILIPNVPAKRKVLLPAGPMEPPRPMMEPPGAAEFVPMPRPTIAMDPSTSMMPPAELPTQNYVAMAPSPVQLEPANPPTTIADMFTLYTQQFSSEPQPQPLPQEPVQQEEEETSQPMEEESTGGFNINAMLAQFTSGPQAESYAPEVYAPDDDQPVYASEINDSPASPSHEPEASSIATIPWSLYPVDVNTEENAEFEAKILQMSQSNEANLRVDPRLRRLLDNQFDRVSSLIGSMAQNVAVDEPPKFQPAAAPTATAVSARPDPRASRDPRKRPAPAPAPAPEQSAPSSSNASELRVLYDANDQHALIHGYADPNDPATWSTDVDHRPNFNQYGGSPPPRHDSAYHGGNDRHYNGSGAGSGYPDSYGGSGSYRSSYRGGEGRYRGRGRGHWNRERPPRDSRYHRHEYDNEDDPRTRRNGTHAPSAAQPAAEVPQPISEQPAAPPQPMSLREKRKDNIYESPLSRPPGGARY